MFKKITDFLNHERYQAIAIALICALLVWLYSCESKVRSVQNPSVMVTRSELSTEVDYYLSQVEIRLVSLDRQDELKQLLTTQALLFAQGGQINPYGVIAAVLGIIGVGATIDNVRKRQVIKTELSRTIEKAKNTTAKC